MWALNTDGFRIFSGDETGQIIVHDFLHVDAHAQPAALKSGPETNKAGFL